MMWGVGRLSVITKRCIDFSGRFSIKIVSAIIQIPERNFLGIHWKVLCRAVYKEIVQAVLLACLFKYVIDDDVFASMHRIHGRSLPIFLKLDIGGKFCWQGKFSYLGGQNLAEYMYEQLFRHFLNRKTFSTFTIKKFQVVF
jgi:hypothetical protein